ncbi:MAG: chitobiase/beta-hexosaminidase C-terminal domain-containing protein, partial [Terracidiphilus sp.]
NGTTPTTSSTVYTGPITVNSTETLEAIAIATGDANAVGMATYTIAPVLPTPAFSLAAGTYTTTQPVTISDSTAGTTIYYTTNGTTPTTSSTKYSGAITVSATETLEAIAVETGYTNSAAGSASYTIAPVLPAPTLSLAAGTYTTTQTVTISDATAGATFYYTTSGTTPTTSSTKYTGAISISATEKLEAIAVETGYTNSAVASATYTLNLPALPTPTFSPAAGTYAKSQAVTIGDATAGATFYYTTNNTTPTTSSTKYTGPVTVGASEKLQAIAVETGYSESGMASASYTITPLPTPTFSVAAGTYTAIQTVTISDATAGATFYYTTNNTTPTTSSTKYTGPVTIGATEKLQVIAVETGYVNSAMASASYTINLPVLSAPKFSPVAGTYAKSQSVIISDATAGTTIYYTTNSTTPTTSSTKYTGAITVGASEKLQAIAVKADYSESDTASASYTITPLPVPKFSPAAGTYAKSQSVTISDATAGTTIYYTTNGTTPTKSSTKYTGAITVGATERLEAIAVETDYIDSSAASASYTITPLPAPTFSPAAGTYVKSQSVTIKDATAGTTIYYSTNGTTPTKSSTKYTGAITVGATEKLEAIAVETDYINSAAASASYTITPLPAPTFSPAAGTYAKSQSVTIKDATAGTTIYYTTNGATPTTSSTKYTGAITVGATERLEAIAVETDYTNSSAASASYTITPLPAPTFSPAAGTYAATQTVKISDATSGTTIYYTTNGTAPTTSSTKYTGAITVGATEKLEAIAVETDYINSAAATAAYTIASGSAAVATPGFTITANPSSALVAFGDSIAFTFKPVPLPSAAPFPPSLNFSAGGLSADAKYGISPAAAAKGDVAETMDIQMARSASSVEPAATSGHGLPPRTALLSLGFFILPFGAKLRHTAKQLGRATHLQPLLVATLAVAAFSGCNSTCRFLGQTYAVTITGTSGALSTFTAVALTVKQ